MDTLVPMTLKDFLTAVLSGAVALGPTLYFLFERWKGFQEIASEHKPWLIAVATCANGNPITTARISSTAADARKRKVRFMGPSTGSREIGSTSPFAPYDAPRHHKKRRGH